MAEKDILRRLPFATFQYVDVTFPSSANTDLIIRHSLQTDAPEEVRWIPVSQESTGSIYRDTSATRRAWGNDHIILRSNTAGLKARLLLFTERL